MEGSLRRRRPAYIRATGACDICGDVYAFSQLSNGLIRNARYGIWVCNRCFRANAHGWDRILEERVLRNLRAAGAPLPARLQNGLLPFD
jgi:hypothetical protein